MRRMPAVFVLTTLALTAAACSDSATAPLTPRPTAVTLARAAGTEISVNMMDACSPSFNDMFGEGTCNRSGGMDVNQFLSQLGKHQEVGAWHFSPPSFNATLGQVIVARNLGGEVHTFTHVAEFGGGFIPELNDLSGTPIPATACLLQNLEEDDFVPPGGKYFEDVDEGGTLKFQCCIHPWMRTVVQVR